MARLRHAGIVRLLDVLLVERLPDGSFDTLAETAGPDLDGALATALLSRDDDGSVPAQGDSGPDATWSLADAVPAGSLAAVALIEHVWATPLLTALRQAGGTPLDEAWLSPDDLARVEALAAGRADPR
jgi:hypothetical protein